MMLTQLTKLNLFSSAETDQNRHADLKTDVNSKLHTSLNIQKKLTIGAVDDPLEDEADAMADKVMRMPEQNFIQRKCAHCEEEEKMNRKPLVSFIQKKCSLWEGEEKGQRKPLASFIQKKHDSQNDSLVADDSISSQIDATRGKGSFMNETTKNFMESKFGADFSKVNIHTGSDASQLSKDLNAQAFTVGNDIYFNEGKFSPNSSEGKHLLAHELTHTIQQNGQNNLIQKDSDDTEVPITTEQPIIIKEIILRPLQGTTGSITFVSIDDKHYRGKLSYQGNPHPGTYNYTNNTLDKEDIKRMGGDGIVKDNKVWIARYIFPKNFHVANEYKLIVINTGLFKENGFLKLTNYEMAELTTLAEGLDEYDLRVFSKYEESKNVNYAKNFKEAKEAILIMKQFKKKYDQFLLESVSLETKLYHLEDTYKLYKAYKCKSGSPAGVFGSIDPCIFKNYEIITKYEGDLKKIKQDLEVQLIAADFDKADPIKDFESLIIRYNETFVKLSLDIALRALDNSQNVAEKELKRYQTSKDSLEIYNKLNAARKARDEVFKYKLLGAEAYNYSGFLSLITFDALAEVESKKSITEYNTVADEYPILSILKREDILDNDRSDFSTGNFSTLIRNQILNIKRARKEIIKNPNYIYRLDALQQLVYNLRNMESGSIFDMIIQDKIASVKDDESLLENILLVVSIALIPFTMGESALIAFAANTALAGIGVYSAVEAIDKYYYERLFYEASLLSDKPSFFWTVVAVAGAGLDVGTAMSSFSKVVSIARKYPDLVTDLSKFNDEIDKAVLIDRIGGVNARLEAVEQRLKDLVKKQAAIQQEIDKACQKVFKSVGSLKMSVTIIPPDVLAAGADLAYRFAKKGYSRFEEFLLNLQRNGLIKDLKNLTSEELTNLKKMHLQGTMQATDELKISQKLEGFTDTQLNEMVETGFGELNEYQQVNRFLKSPESKMAVFEKETSLVGHEEYTKLLTKYGKELADNPSSLDDFLKIGPLTDSETFEWLIHNNEIRKLFAENPAIIKILKKCASPCFPLNATPDDIKRILAVLQKNGDKVDYAKLNQFMYTNRPRGKTPIPNELRKWTNAIEDLENDFMGTMKRVEMPTGKGVKIPPRFQPSGIAPLKGSVKKLDVLIERGFSPKQLEDILAQVQINKIDPNEFLEEIGRATSMLKKNQLNNISGIINGLSSTNLQKFETSYYLIRRMGDYSSGTGVNMVESIVRVFDINEITELRYATINKFGAGMAKATGENSVATMELFYKLVTKIDGSGGEIITLATKAGLNGEANLGRLVTVLDKMPNIKNSIEAVEIKIQQLKMLASEIAESGDRMGEKIWGIAKTGKEYKIGSKFFDSTTGKVSGSKIIAHIRGQADEIAEGLVEKTGIISSSKWQQFRNAIQDSDLEVILKNGIIGDMWGKVHVTAFKKLYGAENVIEQVTIRIKGTAIEAVLDAVIKKDGKILFKEFKSGNAVLSESQELVYDKMAKGLTDELEFVGENAAKVWPDSTKFSVDKVEIISEVDVLK